MTTWQQPTIYQVLHGHWNRRELLRQQGVTPVQVPTMPIDQAQAYIRDQIMAYLAEENPAEMLLIQVDPGAGKTTMLVQIAEWYAEQQQYAEHQKRVFWCLPRHDLYPDVVKHAKTPEWWYHWIPRSGIEKLEVEAPCRYHTEIALWMQKKHPGKEFCDNPRICGFDYINKHCPYWAQKETRHPIVVGVHQHLISGHMLQQQVGLVIGDEYPIGMFAGDLHVPARHIVPYDMPHDQPFTEMVNILQSLALDQEEGIISGRALLDHLGGPRDVLEACQLFEELADEEQTREVRLRTVDAVEQAPYKHIGMLRTYLAKEASAALDPKLADGYIERLSIKNKMLCYATRHELREEFKQIHMIWLDATANKDAYEKAFDRKVRSVKVNIQKQGRTFQIHSSLNSRHAMFDYDQKTKTAIPKPHAHKIKEQLRYIIQQYEYQNPLIITYQALEPFFAELGQTAGLSANRGTDRFNGCDAVFVVGRQEPSGDAVIKLAAALAFDRMHLFDGTKSDRQVTFNYLDAEGYSYSYPKTDYWFEPLLRALLWQIREAEMLQSAHRGRPIWNVCDIWLFTNVAVDELPLDGLYEFADICQSPAGIDPNKWIKLKAFIDQCHAEDKPITPADLMKQFDISDKTARKWTHAIKETFPDQWGDPPVGMIVPVNRGKPRLTLYPLLTNK